MKFVIPVTMFSFSYYTLAGFAITRESGLTGTEIGSLSIGAISIDVTDGMRGGAFIDIWKSKIIEWIDTDHLREEIWMPKSWNFFLACWNPESGKILLLESGILSIGIQNTAQGIGNPTKRNQLTVRYWKKERERSNPEFSFYY